jgi:hypothetical protein
MPPLVHPVRFEHLTVVKHGFMQIVVCRASSQLTGWERRAVLETTSWRS